MACLLGPYLPASLLCQVRCLKNRYGNTDEVGVFSMHQDGLRVVPDPSQLFLSSRQVLFCLSLLLCLIHS